MRWRITYAFHTEHGRGIHSTCADHLGSFPWNWLGREIKWAIAVRRGLR